MPGLRADLTVDRFAVAVRFPATSDNSRLTFLATVLDLCSCGLRDAHIARLSTGETICLHAAPWIGADVATRDLAFDFRNPAPVWLLNFRCLLTQGVYDSPPPSGDTSYLVPDVFGQCDRAYDIRAVSGQYLVY